MKPSCAMRRRCAVWLNAFLFLLLASADVLARCDIRPAPRALPPAEPHELVVATQNLWRFVDTHSDASADTPVSPEFLDRRLDDIALHVRETLSAPHVLALQEVENLSVLESLAKRIVEQGGPRYRAYLREGSDPSGIDVALLVRDPVQVESVDDLFEDARFRRHALFSRPPLHARISKPVALELVVVHLRSGHGLQDRHRAETVREKRRRQALMLREWLDAREAREVPVAVIGDLNTAEGSNPYGEPHAILVQGNVSEAWDLLPEGERFSYVWHCAPQAIDNILFGPVLRDRVTRGAVSRGNAGHQHRLYDGTAERLVSDHDAVALYISTVVDHIVPVCRERNGETKKSGRHAAKESAGQEAEREPEERKARTENAGRIQGPEGPC